MEWLSLTLFTVLSEAAIGLVLVWWLLGFSGAAVTKVTAYTRLGRTILLSSGLLTGLSMLISLEHLGWPFSSPRVLMGLGHSWLSWEVVLTGIFAVGALALWWLGRSGNISRMISGLLVLVGLGAAFTSGMVWSMPSVPANAGGFPVLLFLATTLAVGAVLLLALFAFTADGKALAPEMAGALSLLALGATLLAGALALGFAGAAAHGSPEARHQATAMTSSGLHMARLLAGLLLPAALLGYLARQPKRSALSALPAVLLVAGEIAGRFLFFSTMTFTAVGG